MRTLCRAHANPWPQANPPPSLQIAWSTAGLLLEITSHHAHPIECDYIRQLFRGDSVEFFLSTRKGSRDRYMLLISPGLDPRYPQPRHCFFPDPSEEGEKDMSDYRFDCTRTPTPDGYRLRVLLPWSNLNLSPAPNTELALQVYVMEAQPHGLPLVAMWNPLGQSHLDPQSTQRVRLVDSPVSPVQLNTAAQDDPQHQLRTVRIVAPLACAGRSFLLQGSDGTQVSGTLAAVGVQAFAELSVPIGQSCQVQLGSEISTVPILPPPDDLATIMTQKLQCTFTPTLFDSDLFPEPKISGAPHYRLQKVTYFDATYHPLSSPLTPGRYGAVVEIADASNNITRRFRTLFRLPPHSPPLTPGQSVPAPPWISPNPDNAPPGVTPSDSTSIDRQWWVGLKRKLNGWDRQFPDPFVAPLRIATPSPMLRDGSPTEAAVDPQKVTALDRLAGSLSQQSGEPLQICLARHGIIFLNKAYGQLDGRPLTIDDPCDIKSATKPLAGVLMAMVIDQRLLKIDQPIDTILPAFRRYPVKRQITIRDLYAHTAGLVGDWGDEIHDTDEIVAGYYTTLDVGNYSYNEVGYALGGKIIEAVSGEAFPQFACRHLLEPLGMLHTRVTHAGGHNATTALDYARLGQLLLNKGTYGNLRFFSEATYTAMLPPAGADNRRGLGLMSMNLTKYGFSPHTFGHNAGNSSLMVVDPDHDLVMTIASPGSRKDFSAIADPFYRAVIAALK